MGTQNEERDPEPHPLMKVVVYPFRMTTRTVVTLTTLGTIAAVLAFEEKTGMSLADVVFAAKMVNTK